MQPDFLFNIYQFNTPHFSVRIDALHEFDPDLSWDDDGSVTDRIENGDLEIFCACARVTHKDSGVEGIEYLGNCVYECAKDFLSGGYARDMVSSAVTECRNKLASAASALV